MITVYINDKTKQFDDPGFDRWVAEAIERRREDGAPLCVRVRLVLDNVDLTLSSYGCPAAFGSRSANSKETKIIDLWTARGMQNADFTAGSLLGFLHELRP